ncbi:MAG: hypothetical protein ACYCSS_12665 [Sulfuriferula sp.]
MLNHLLEKFRITGRLSEASPLDSLNATHQWVDALQAMHEYEAHQQVVLMLAKFNQSNPPFNEQRLHILGLIEHYGSKLQHGLITQFLKNQAGLKHADKSFWPEITAFYWQLAQAYQRISLSLLHRQKYASSLPTMVLRALHYQGKLIQWRYLRYELPTPEVWGSLHRLYHLAVEQGFADHDIVLKGSAYCSCQEVYARILLLHLMRPVGLSPNEIELAAYWAWKWRDTVQLSQNLDPDLHTHFVGLQDCSPPQSLGSHSTYSTSVYYWSITDTVTKLKDITYDLKQSATQIKLYGVLYTADKYALIQHIRAKLGSRTTSAAADIKNMHDQIHVSWGEKVVVAALANPGSRAPVLASHQAIGHPDENYYRLNINLDAMDSGASSNGLLIVYNEHLTEIPALSVIRWIEKSSQSNLTLGMERIGFMPRVVTFHPVTDAAAPSPFACKSTDREFIAIALTQPCTLISFHAVHWKYLDIRDGDYLYRIRIQAILEQNRNWLRVQFTRLTRSYQPKQPS